MLIAVDWGTSRLRAMLVDDAGTLIEERHSDDGIGAVAAGGHEAAFEKLVAGWARAPAIMAGMVGSRQGWREAAYVPCPAAPDALAAKLLRFTTSNGRAVAIVPGLVVRDRSRDDDVLRGEETQIVGLLAREPVFDGVCVLPGTHSKWARVSGGTVQDFQTYFSGEMFDLLSRHSFLRHSVATGAKDLSASPDFALGVRRTAVEGLPFLAAVFSVRVRQLLDNVDREQNLAYLSGLVIGAELAAAVASGRLEIGMAIRVAGAPALTRAYLRAFELIERQAIPLDGSSLVLSGLVHLARVLGWLPKGHGQ